MMECYQAYADYREMMDLVEAMFGAIAVSVLGGLRTMVQGREIDFSPPWPRIGMQDAIRSASGIDILAATTNDALVGEMRARGLEVPAGPSWGRTVDELFSALVEPTLLQPTFVMDHPVELSPLAKRSVRDPRLVERFECFVAGMELGNAFSELNDPDDQRARFEEARRDAAAGDDEAHPMDEEFLRALEHGMPPTGGLGVGVDRLAMVLADAPSLRETILFPHMKPERGE
jgi:lysyl-tRNA synthetase class 2